MTAAILHFPAPAANIPTPDRAALIVAAARAVLRSAANHSDDILTEACDALQRWGDPTDWLEADAMLLAIRLRAHGRAHEAAEVAPRNGLIRGALVDIAGLAVLAAFATAVYHLAGV